mmetsp:Transcript_4469/g.13994  ORF Transcript_4469/g.13994 Transcript_4469/m.13994 type:complete len:298 (+) Transcript_4469:448-1341(+)
MTWVRIFDPNAMMAAWREPRLLGAHREIFRYPSRHYDEAKIFFVFANADAQSRYEESMYLDWMPALKAALENDSKARREPCQSTSETGTRKVDGNNGGDTGNDDRDTGLKRLRSMDSTDESTRGAKIVREEALSRNQAETRKIEGSGGRNTGLKRLGSSTDESTRGAPKKKKKKKSTKRSFASDEEAFAVLDKPPCYDSLADKNEETQKQSAWYDAFTEKTLRAYAKHYIEDLNVRDQPNWTVRPNTRKGNLVDCLVARDKAKSEDEQGAEGVRKLEAAHEKFEEFLALLWLSGSQE